MKTYKFDMTEETSMPVDKKTVDQPAPEEKKATEVKEEPTEKKPKKKVSPLSIVAILLAFLGLGISFFEFACINLPSIIDCAYFPLASLRITGILIIYFGGLIRDIALLIIGAVGFIISLASLVLNMKDKNYIATVVGIIATLIGLIGVTQCVAGIVHHIIPDMIEMVSRIMSGQLF